MTKTRVPTVHPPNMPRFLAWLCLVLLVGCGSASPRIASPEASDWEAQVLGGAPDARLILQVEEANADPVYGGPPTAYDRRDPKDAELEALLRGVRSIELWFVVDDRNAERSSLLVLVRGKPDFEALRRHPDTRALFARKPEQLPSGVLAYPVSEDSTPVVFYLLPSGSWVIAAGRISGRVRYHLFSHGGDPPPAPSERDALMAMWVGPGAVRLAEVEKSAKGFQELSLAIRSSRSGDMELSAKFASEKDAKAALASIQEALKQLPAAQKALADQCPAWEGVRFGLEREGRTLSGRVSNLPPLVRAYRTGACHRDR